MGLGDEEIKAVVSRLQRDVREKAAQLEALNKDISTISAAILSQQTDRQKFAKVLLKAEEAAPVIEESRQLRTALKARQEHLTRLQEGSAKEQSELEELIRRVREVESGSRWRELEEQTKEHVSALGELEAAYEQQQKLCQTIKENLERVQEEFVSLKRRPGKEHRKKDVDAQLDALIHKCCRKAGLSLK